MKSNPVNIFLTALVLTVAALLLTSVVPAYASPYTGYAIMRDSIAVDSAAATDSLSKDGAKKDAIDAPVYYECTDSMVWSRTGNAYLYGAGKVRYDKIELTADVIKLNMDSSVVHASDKIFFNNIL